MLGVVRTAVSLTASAMMLALTLKREAPPLADAVKGPVVFACDLKALTPAQRKRQATVLSPALQSAWLGSQELTDGYALAFPNDRTTQGQLMEWVGNERLCCPFLAFDVHVGHDSPRLMLRITGPDEAKPFIQSEFSGILG